MSTTYEVASCPACISGTHELVADAAALRAELETLWEHHTGDGRPALSMAQLVDRVAFTHAPPLAIVRCSDCGLLFRNPRERYVRELYETEILDEPALGALREAQRATFRDQVERLTSLHGGPGRVLEVGSYVGAFLDAARAAGWQTLGVDVNPQAVAFQQRSGHAVAPGSIEDVPESERFDAIAFWNCFDQLDDPLASARAACARLKPGGLLAVRVPNGEVYLKLRAYLSGPLAATARTLLARHNLLGFPYRHGFTSASLRRLLERAGLAVVEEHDARVLPTVDEGAGLGGERLLDAAERALRPLVGPPWLEVYARRDRRRAPRR